MAKKKKKQDYNLLAQSMLKNNPKYAKGGNAKKYTLDEIAKKGRMGDSELAHVNPVEAEILKSLGASGTINPETGLREYIAPAIAAAAPMIAKAVPALAGIFGGGAAAAGAAGAGAAGGGLAGLIGGGAGAGVGGALSGALGGGTGAQIAGQGAQMLMNNPQMAQGIMKNIPKPPMPGAGGNTPGMNIPKPPMPSIPGLGGLNMPKIPFMGKDGGPAMKSYQTGANVIPPNFDLSKATMNQSPGFQNLQNEEFTSPASQQFVGGVVPPTSGQGGSGNFADSQNFFGNLKQAKFGEALKNIGGRKTDALVGSGQAGLGAATSLLKGDLKGFGAGVADMVTGITDIWKGNRIEEKISGIKGDNIFAIQDASADKNVDKYGNVIDPSKVENQDIQGISQADLADAVELGVTDESGGGLKQEQQTARRDIFNKKFDEIKKDATQSYQANYNQFIQPFQQMGEQAIQQGGQALEGMVQQNVTTPLQEGFSNMLGNSDALQAFNQMLIPNAPGAMKHGSHVKYDHGGSIPNYNDGSKVRKGHHKVSWLTPDQIDIMKTARQYLVEQGFGKDAYTQDYKNYLLKGGDEPLQSSYKPSDDVLTEMSNYMASKFDPEQIKDFQGRLGYLTGTDKFQYQGGEEKDFIDGIFGPATAGALMDYHLGFLQKGLKGNPKMFDKRIKSTSIDFTQPKSFSEFKQGDIETEAEDTAAVNLASGAVDRTFRNGDDVTKRRPIVTVGGKTIAPEDRTTKNLDFGLGDLASRMAPGLDLNIPLLRKLLIDTKKFDLAGNLNLNTTQYMSPGGTQNVEEMHKVMEENVTPMGQHLTNPDTFMGAYEDISNPQIENVGKSLGLGLDATYAPRGKWGTMFDFGLSGDVSHGRGEHHREFMAPTEHEDFGAVMDFYDRDTKSGLIEPGVGYGLRGSLGFRRPSGLSAELFGSYGSKKALNPGKRLGVDASIPLSDFMGGKLSFNPSASYDFKGKTPRFGAGVGFNFEDGGDAAQYQGEAPMQEDYVEVPPGYEGTFTIPGKNEEQGGTIMNTPAEGMGNEEIIVNEAGPEVAEVAGGETFIYPNGKFSKEKKKLDKQRTAIESKLSNAKDEFEATTLQRMLEQNNIAQADLKQRVKDARAKKEASAKQKIDELLTAGTSISEEGSYRKGGKVKKLSNIEKETLVNMYMGGDLKKYEEGDEVRYRIKKEDGVYKIYDSTGKKSIRNLYSGDQAVLDKKLNNWLRSKGVTGGMSDKSVAGINNDFDAAYPTDDTGKDLVVEEQIEENITPTETETAEEIDPFTALVNQQKDIATEIMNNDTLSKEEKEGELAKLDPFVIEQAKEDDPEFATSLQDFATVEIPEVEIREDRITQPVLPIGFDPNKPMTSGYVVPSPTEGLVEIDPNTAVMPPRDISPEDRERERITRELSQIDLGPEINEEEEAVNDIPQSVPPRVESIPYTPDLGGPTTATLDPNMDEGDKTKQLKRWERKALRDPFSLADLFKFKPTKKEEPGFRGPGDDIAEKALAEGVSTQKDITDRMWRASDKAPNVGEDLMKQSRFDYDSAIDNLKLANKGIKADIDRTMGARMAGADRFRSIQDQEAYKQNIANDALVQNMKADSLLANALADIQGKKATQEMTANVYGDKFALEQFDRDEAAKDAYFTALSQNAADATAAGLLLGKNRNDMLTNMLMAQNTGAGNYMYNPDSGKIEFRALMGGYAKKSKKKRRRK